MDVKCSCDLEQLRCFVLDLLNNFLPDVLASVDFHCTLSVKRQSSFQAHLASVRSGRRAAYEDKMSHLFACSSHARTGAPEAALGKPASGYGL